MYPILYRGQTRKFGDKVRMNGMKLPGIWVYGGVAQGSGAYSIIYGSADNEPINKHVVYSETLGQYIGQDDVHGKKIFEDDILRSSNGVLFVVEWDNAHSRFMGYTVDGHHEVFIDEVSYKEIIGNIHDNPELLKLEESNGT